MVDEAARRLAEYLVTNAPTGWTEAVWASVAGRHNTRSSTPRYTVPGGPVRRQRFPNFFGVLGSLAQEVRAVRGWESASFEIRCRSNGEYQVVAFTDTVIASPGPCGGYLAVLDPGYRLPQPGDDQEPGAASPAGDPELAAARFGEYLRRRAAILGRVEKLPAPVCEAALDEAERRIGQPLPADLRALYLVADGDGVDFGQRYLFGGNTWLPLEYLAGVHTDHREPRWSGWWAEWNAVVFDADPAETVRRCGGHPGWVPFASGEDGNYLAVDLAPAAHGRPGQVIAMGRDFRDGPVYIADSITSLLGHYMDLLDQRSFEVREGRIWLREPHSRKRPRTILGDSIAIPVPADVQDIHLNDAGLVQPGSAGHEYEPAAAAPQPLRHRRPGTDPGTAAGIAARDP